MALTKELRQAYTEAGVTEAQIATLEEVFTNEEILSKLTAQHMKAADYTTKTQALSDARKALDKERNEFNEGQDYVNQQTNAWKTDIEGRLNAALAQVAKSRTYGATLETKLQTLAAQYGEDFEDLMTDVQTIRDKEPEKKKEAFDDEEFKKRYIPRDEFTREAGNVVSFTTQIRDFEREYARTFGKEYDGSITELVNGASKTVQERRARGQNVDLFGVMREKLDFNGQVTRNQEAEKTKVAEERKTWETQTREEIERDIRSKVLAENPNALKAVSFNKPEVWRQNLGSKARQNQLPDRTPQAEHAHRTTLHQKFMDNAAKVGAA